MRTFTEYTHDLYAKSRYSMEKSIEEIKVEKELSRKKHDATIVACNAYNKALREGDETAASIAKLAMQMNLRH